MPLYEHFPASPSRQAAREKLALSADQFIVLFLGLIRAYKGLDILLQALVQVPAAQLLIAGEFYRPR
ncbi:MAG: glycosyl transferase family 1, partial [candidate division KSB1 bacterium]|nr:glycosyl transferase family 1 [candidate division KSB1 bacterium]